MSAHCLVSPLVTSVGCPQPGHCPSLTCPGPRSLGAPQEGKEHSLQGRGFAVSDAHTGRRGLPGSPGGAVLRQGRVLCSGAGSQGRQPRWAGSRVFSAHSLPLTCVSHCHPERWVQPPRLSHQKAEPLKCPASPRA